MSKDNGDTYVLVKNSKGENYLCPINAIQNPSSIVNDEMDDCVEEDVIRRYAGNLKLKSS